jgi:hypothetical protein
MLFSVKAQHLVQLALCNALLLPSPGMTDQLWNLRQKQLAHLICALTYDLQRVARLSTQRPEQRACSIITPSLRLLGDLVKYVQSESSHSKKLLYSVIQVCVHSCIALWLPHTTFHSILYNNIIAP